MWDAIEIVLYAIAVLALGGIVLGAIGFLLGIFTDRRR
jgi:hypothetical protein